MRCTHCGYEHTKVIESRLSHEGRSVRRRRSCLECNYRFTTYEKEEELCFQVQKKDGRFEAYLRDKLISGVQVACQKRPIAPEVIEALVNRVERRVLEDGGRTVSTDTLGDHVMRELHELDHVAYVRFASVYKDFKDPQEFLNTLKALKSKHEAEDASNQLGPQLDV